MMCIAEQAPVVAILKLKVLEPQGLVTIQVNILSMTMYCKKDNTLMKQHITVFTANNKELNQTGF
jgi:hypothetical protein